ncbi:MAG: hypothetical protein ACREEE_10795 [Dongiaceae bacterium]
MRPRFLALTLSSLLSPSGMATAGEMLVPVDCICLAQRFGYVAARSDATAEQLGIDRLLPGDPIIRLLAPENGCEVQRNACPDSKYTPMVGELRMNMTGYTFLDTQNDYKLTIEGVIIGGVPDDGNQQPAEGSVP